MVFIISPAIFFLITPMTSTTTTTTVFIIVTLIAFSLLNKILSLRSSLHRLEFFTFCEDQKTKTFNNQSWKVKRIRCFATLPVEHIICVRPVEFAATGQAVVQLDQRRRPGEKKKTRTRIRTETSRIISQLLPVCSTNAYQSSCLVNFHAVERVVGNLEENLRIHNNDLLSNGAKRSQVRLITGTLSISFPTYLDCKDWEPLVV